MKAKVVIFFYLFNQRRWKYVFIKNVFFYIYIHIKFLHCLVPKNSRMSICIEKIDNHDFREDGQRCFLP